LSPLINVMLYDFCIFISKVRMTYTNFMFCLGLVAVGEKAQKRSGHYVVMKDLSGEIFIIFKNAQKAH